MRCVRPLAGDGLGGGADAAGRRVVAGGAPGAGRADGGDQRRPPQLDHARRRRPGARLCLAPGDAPDRSGWLPVHRLRGRRHRAAGPGHGPGAWPRALRLGDAGAVLALGLTRVARPIPHELAETFGSSAGETHEMAETYGILYSEGSLTRHRTNRAGWRSVPESRVVTVTSATSSIPDGCSSQSRRPSSNGAQIRCSAGVAFQAMPWIALASATAIG